MIDIKNVILTNTSVSLWFLSWNPSWSSVNERVLNYRNTQTPSCNTLPITVRTSWSRWSTLWRSPADRTRSRSRALPPPPLPASPSLSSVFHLISQDASPQTPSPTCTNQRTDTYGKDWQLTSQVHAWIGFGVWEWWAFLLPSPTTTFILSAPSESCLRSHKHGKEKNQQHESLVL